MCETIEEGPTQAGLEPNTLDMPDLHSRTANSDRRHRWRHRGLHPEWSSTPAAGKRPSHRGPRTERPTAPAAGKPDRPTYNEPHHFPLDVQKATRPGLERPLVRRL